MSKFTVVAGRYSEDLARNLARKLKAKLVTSDVRIFPDGESKITLSKKLSKNTVVIVHAIHPPVDTNLIHVLSLVSKAKEIATNVIAVIPYMGYARQDREFLEGEVVTMKVIAQLFNGVGTSKVVVVDIHSMIGLKHFKIKTENVSAIPELARYFQKIRLKNPLVVSPDKGGEQRAKEFAVNFGSEYIALVKHRDRKTGNVEIKTPNIDKVRNRDVILVDDMISTGGSIIKSTKFLKKQRCGRIFVACTHALLIDNAGEKIRKAGVSKIISTNTISGKTSIVDVSNAIAQAIK